METGGQVRDVNGTLIRPGAIATFLDVHETCYNCWYCLVAKSSTRCQSITTQDGSTYSYNKYPNVLKWVQV